ncbi:hypothetical protein BGZ74_000372 [Mortierella antarctica]|nr:hypothetical protein BGZ74_000372 [Mortierella antarctica]
MVDYYDSWSANKRRKNLSRRSVHASLDQQGTEHVLNRHLSSATPFVPARSTTPTLSSPIPTRAGFSLTKFSPVLPRTWGRSDVEKGSPAQGRSGTTWRANTHPMAVDNVARDAFDKDFDDDDDVDDDEDDDDDNNGLHAVHAIQQHNTFNSRPRHELEGIIEQLVGDEFVAPYTDLLPMAKSSPALPVSDSSADNPYSTSTFNARLHPQPIIRVQNTPRGKEGRKQRPWSQVIWESPIMDGSIAPRQRVYDHAATVGGKYESYPALTKDLFTQRTPDMIISKSVRINIDAPDTPPIPRRPVRTPERSSQGATLLPVPATGRREFSHSRKHSHRLSLGSGFYATLEPYPKARDFTGRGHYTPAQATKPATGDETACAYSMGATGAYECSGQCKNISWNWYQPSSRERTRNFHLMLGS